MSRPFETPVDLSTWNDKLLFWRKRVARLAPTYHLTLILSLLVRLSDAPITRTVEEWKTSLVSSHQCRWSFMASDHICIRISGLMTIVVQSGKNTTIQVCTSLTNRRFANFAHKGSQNLEMLSYYVIRSRERGCMSWNECS